MCLDQLHALEFQFKFQFWFIVSDGIGRKILRVSLGKMLNGVWKVWTICSRYCEFDRINYSNLDGIGDENVPLPPFKRSASRAVKHFIGILNRLINELTYIAIVVACVQLDRAMLTILHGHM